MTNFVKTVEIPEIGVKVNKYPESSCVWGELWLQYEKGEISAKDLIKQTESNQLKLNFKERKIG